MRAVVGLARIQTSTRGIVRQVSSRNLRAVARSRQRQLQRGAFRAKHEEFWDRHVLERCDSNVAQISPAGTKMFLWMIYMGIATLVTAAATEFHYHHNSGCDSSEDASTMKSSNNLQQKENQENADQTLAPAFPFYELILEQVQVVVYSEDRDATTITSDSGRNKPTGLVGLACKHCIAAHPQTSLDPNATIFPQDRRSLAREVVTKLYTHLATCQHCPLRTRKRLTELASQTSHRNSSTKKIPMSRDERHFFRNLWYEMGHKDMPVNEKPRRRIRHDENVVN